MKAVLSITALILTLAFLASQLAADGKPSTTEEQVTRVCMYNSDDGRAVVTLVLSPTGLDNAALGATAELHFVSIVDGLNMLDASFASMGTTGEFDGPKVVDFGDYIVTLTPQVPSWLDVEQDGDVVVTFRRTSGDGN